MKLFRENECFTCSLNRIRVFVFGSTAEKKTIEKNDAAYFKAIVDAELRAEAARKEQDRLNRIQEEIEARKEREQESAERKLERAREVKQRRIAKNRVIKAKRFVKIKKLRKVHRNGSTVFVNQNNDIVHYAILAYLLSDHGNGNSYTESSPSYSYSSSSSSSDSSWSSGGSDFGGSFGGGDSGGGGASGSW